MPTSKKYQDLLADSLKDPQEAIAYLTEVLREYEKADQESQKLFYMALESILEALDRREDMALSTTAKIRDYKTAKKVKHKDAWR